MPTVLTLPTPDGGEADIEVTLMNLGLGLAITAVRPPAVPAPVASFTGTPVSGTDPLTVAFTDASSNTPTSWLWERNSGGGWSTFSTSQNPSQSFAAGTWSVRLTATNAGGSDTQTRTSYLTIAAAGIVQLGSATGYGGALGFAFSGQDTTGANFLSVQLSGWSNWAALPTVTDSRGNTWTRSADIGVGSSNSVIFTCVPTSVGAAHIVTVSGANLYGSGVLRWFSGVKQTSTVEATRATNNTRTDTFTTANDGDLILTCSGAGANSTNYDPGDLTTPASGYSPVKVLSKPDGITTSFGIATGAGIKATAGSVTTTYTGGDSSGTATAIVRKA